MSLFDGQQERGKERKTKKVKNVLKTKPSENQEHLIEPTYGLGTRSYNRSQAARHVRDERAKITEAYERGEIKFADCSPDFLLCHCSGPPEYHAFPHEIHRTELANFELQHYGRKNEKHK